MKFNEWLNESTSAPINSDDFIKKIKKDCSDFIKLFKNDVESVVNNGKNEDDIIDKLLYELPLFKSARDNKNKTLYNTPSPVDYAVPAGIHLINDIIDSGRQWTAFPKRTNSIELCTSSDYSQMKGYLTICFPTNGSKFGVVPEEDILISWAGAIGSNLDFSETIEEFIETVEDNSMLMMDETVKSIIKQVRSKYLFTMENFANLIQKIIEKNLLGDRSFDYKFLRKFNNKNTELNDILNTLEQMFSPKNCRFIVTDVKGLLRYKGTSYEMWTQDPCYSLGVINNPTLVDDIKEIFSI
jgi:hypothetical protein